MLKIKFFLLMFLALSFFVGLARAEEIEEVAISLKLNYYFGKVTIGDVTLVENLDPITNLKTDGEYSLKILSFLDEELYVNYFDFELEFEIYPIPLDEWFDEQGNQIVIPVEDSPRQIKLNETTKFLFVPYFTNAKTIKIYAKEQEILSIDTSDFAVCNQNKVCEQGESYDTCSYDCKPSFKQRLILIWQKIINFFKRVFKLK